MLASRGRDYDASHALGSLHARIKEAKVLMVGAGGIGCELLKNLVLTGFGEVHVVDLDTIDLSNLNRQFLFRHEHIKRSKALVAKGSAAKFNPNVKIEAHHANIKDPQFNVDWFSQFNIVFNALDNLDARRHVNRMCLMADVPLVESGTTGYNGQVQVIKKAKTECYDCNVKETPKTFPVCTIRSTPSQPIHCIVWAKSYLFTEIFGVGEEEAPELDHSESADNKDELEMLRQETSALKRIRESMGSEKYPRMIFDKVFKNDIERLRSMEDMWESKSRTPPEPLDYSQLSSSSVESSVSQQDQSSWTLEENFAVFVDSLKRLSNRLQELRKAATDGAPAILTFDKDDVDALDFVAASANLRSHIFGIPVRSKFDIKQMAGNIVPAIATTNAMTAGLCVLQAFKILRDELRRAKMVFLTRSTDRIISSEPLRPPKPDCPVCGVAQAKLVIDPSRATLNDLVDGVLRLELGYGEELSVSGDSGVVYDPELEDNLSKKFQDLGIKGDSLITVVDEDDDNPRVNLVFSVSEKALPDDSKPVFAPEKPEIARRTRADQANGHDVGGDKRKRSAEDAGLDEDHATKRGKVAEATANGIKDNDDDVILVGAKAPTNGAIVIDD